MYLNRQSPWIKVFKLFYKIHVCLCQTLRMCGLQCASFVATIGFWKRSSKREKSKIESWKGSQNKEREKVRLRLFAQKSVYFGLLAGGKMYVHFFCCYFCNHTDWLETKYVESQIIKRVSSLWLWICKRETQMSSGGTGTIKNYFDSLLAWYKCFNIYANTQDGPSFSVSDAVGVWHNGPLRS